MGRKGRLRFKQIGEVVTTIPTIGFNVESVTYGNLNFNVWVGYCTGSISEASLTTLGSGRSDLDTTLLAVLLCKYRCSDFRDRFDRH